MKKKLMFLLTFVMMWIWAVPASAASKPVLPTDVSVPSKNCIFLGVEGRYIADIQNALNRINQIRYEACREGVTNPNTGTPLQKKDYVPIKWSSDLEYIARIRAAESSLTMHHSRLNNKIWYELKGPKGGQSCAEVIAWNWSSSMTYGIDQWYEEKADWVNNTGEVTGHYTSMIDPANRYVGLGTFYSENAAMWPNTTVGEFSGQLDLDEAKGKSVPACIQTVEVDRKYLLSNTYGISGTIPKKTGQTGSLAMTVGIDYNGTRSTGLRLLSSVTWSSSRPAAAAVDANGTIRVRGCGAVDITARASTGAYAKRRLTFAHNWGKGTVTKQSTALKTGIRKYTCSGCKASRTEKIPVYKLRKGRTYTVGSFKYKLTNANLKGKGTVMLVGTTVNRTALKSLKVPDTVRIRGVRFKVTALGSRAFRGFSKLSSASIGKYVKIIGTDTFRNCKSLKSIRIRSRSLTKVGKNSIRNIYKKAVIRVPSGKRSSYKKLLNGSTGYQKRIRIR
nr:CAP domain-containing protein [uncultured Blautia sp.]